MLVLTILEYRRIVESKATAHRIIGRTELRHRRSAILHELGPSRTPLAGNASRCSLLLTVFLSLLSRFYGDYRRACIEISGHRQSPGDDCRLKGVFDEHKLCRSLVSFAQPCGTCRVNRLHPIHTQNNESTCSSFY
jgi:hypothetical protein